MQNFLPEYCREILKLHGHLNNLKEQSKLASPCDMSISITSSPSYILFLLASCILIINNTHSQKRKPASKHIFQVAIVLMIGMVGYKGMGQTDALETDVVSSVTHGTLST